MFDTQQICTIRSLQLRVCSAHSSCHVPGIMYSQSELRYKHCNHSSVRSEHVKHSRCFIYES